LVSLNLIQAIERAGSSERMGQVIAASVAVPNPEAPGAQGFDAALFGISSGEDSAHSVFFEH
jgi:hypothetical protein